MLNKCAVECLLHESVACVTWELSGVETIVYFLTKFSEDEVNSEHIIWTANVMTLKK